MTTGHLDESAGADGLPAYISRESCDAAHRRIAPHIIQTPLEPSPELSRRLAAEVLLKLENLEVSGSFKLRGEIGRAHV